MSPPRPVSCTSTPRDVKRVGCRENVRAAAVAAHAERQHVRMLEQQQQVVDAPGAPLFDERPLQREASAYGTRPSRRTSTFAWRALAAAGSQFSSVCFRCDMNSSATAPSINAVVVAERQIPHRPDRDRIVDHDGTFLDVADAEDRHLRLVDDRHAEQRAEHAGIRDGERAAADFVRLELLRARARRQIRDRAAQAEQVLFVRVLDDGDDQPPVERDRDAEVDVLVIDDVVAVDRGVDDRHGAKRVDDGLQDERQKGQLGAGGLVLRFLRLADLAPRARS